ncbi:MAG: hypothetical protein A3F17_08580 [Gammaproteobacteria bacterium RIFCSPHIGHO2_12_FULL_41_15]|nr:MAG: hypothetical protein A3F17_08580 [Gammaproteobacteria bacterium RIFCSPHIGHO2_12_FULL_41_15]
MAFVQVEKMRQLCKKFSPCPISHVPPESAVVIFSVPKSGTNLFRKALEFICGCGIYASHLQFTDDNIYLRKHLEIKVIVPLRDPRDVLVSSVYHADIYYRADSETPQHYNHLFDPEIPDKPMHYTLTKEFMLEWTRASFDEKLMMYMDPEKLPISPLYDFELLDDFITNRPLNTLIVRYEDIIGPLGGGDTVHQKKAVERIANFVGIPFTTNELYANFSKNIFGDTSTFRKGTIGSWKDHFKPYHTEYFNKIQNGILEKFLYREIL